MPQSIWKGAISFGLVSIPVRLYSATDEKDISFRQVHREDGGRIRYQKVCSIDGETVEWSAIAKGYETDDGKLVVLDDDDFARLPLTSSREIEVLEFVPSDQVDPILLGRTYYLEPDKSAVKPYALLRGALEQADRMAVVSVALRQRESMAVLRVRGDVICLQTLLWPDEVREADFPVLGTEVSVRPQELAMASSLIESLAADFDPSQYHDRYGAALSELIEEKIATGSTRDQPAAPTPEGESGGEVVDLLAALQRSVEKARGSRSGGGSTDAAAAGAGARASGKKRAPADDPAATPADDETADADGTADAPAKAPVRRSRRKAS